MGCLNSDENFSHWFGNIHLSGPCNRSCYFCIGQHMMALDNYNVLNTWPLPGLDKFVSRCTERDVHEINVTGTNTDPLLYWNMRKLRDYLTMHIPNLSFGIRTNGVAKDRLGVWQQFNKGSITICSFDKSINAKMMGGPPPDLEYLLCHATRSMLKNIKVNIVLGPENVRPDLDSTIIKCLQLGIKRVNLREPYGQPTVGDPFKGHPPKETRYGMPVYDLFGLGTEVMYWDVHYVEVESVNLYASGRVSETYPITKGHSPDGFVLDQTHFLKSGRVREQWIKEPTALCQLSQRIDQITATVGKKPAS